MKYHKIFCTVIFFFLLVSISLSQEALILKPDLRTSHLPFGLTNKVKPEKPVIALVLSGGGARGAAQVGVLKALVEENIDFEIIVGTSIGSIVGGLYSVGYTVNQLDSILKNSNWEEITSLQERRRSNLFVEQKVTEDRNLFSLRLDGLTPIIPTSLSNGNKILNFLNLLTLKAPIVSKNFDNYLKKFRAVCTDLKTGKAATLDHGNLAEVMRASSSVSFFLKPLEIDDMLLADGGLVANIPVAEAKKAGADFIIAVNTTSPLREYQELEKPWFLADQVVSIPMKQLENRDIELADVVISPDLDHASNDFSGLDSLIDIGYKTAKNIIPEIKKLISQKTKSVVTADSILQISSSSYAGAGYYQEFDALNKKSLKISEIKNVLNNVYNKYGVEPVIEIRNHGNESVLFYYEIKEKNIDEIKLNGVSLNNFDFEKKYFETLLNKPFNTFSLSNSLLELLRAYRTDQKYLIYPQLIQFDKTSGVLRIDLSSDLVDTISITGNRKTNESVIRREIVFAQNELFNPSSVSQTFNNLNGTNLFELYSVDVSNNLLTNQLSLKILEKNSGIIRIGIRADNERNAQLGLDIRDENFLGYAYEIGFTFLGGLRNRTFSFENRANRLFNSVFTYELELFHSLIDKYVYQNAPETTIQNWDRVQSGEYKTIKYGLRFSVGAQIEKLGNLYVDFKRYKAEVTPLKNAVDKNFNNNLFTFKFGALFDSRDRYPFPLEGILMNTYYETSQRFLGGELGYSKIFFQYEAFFSYFKRHTLHPRFIFGFGDETLPLFDQFFLGGQNSFMGLNEDDLYGRQIFLASLEYRIFLPFKIFFDTYLNVRYDLGGAWLTPSAVRYVELRHGLGVGLSLDTPIGAANFAIGRGFFIRNDILKKPLSFGPYMFYFELGYPI